MCGDEEEGDKKRDGGVGHVVLIFKLMKYLKKADHLRLGISFLRSVTTFQSASRLVSSFYSYFNLNSTCFCVSPSMSRWFCSIFLSSERQKSLRLRL